MDEQTRQERLGQFEQKCRQEHIPITIQRRVIFEAVLELDEHPTADQVFEAVSDRLPQVSRTTVYRTLETLARMGLISKACHPGSVVRYDNRTDNHHHLICLHCDRVIDVQNGELDRVPVPDVSELEFEISEIRVQLRGMCRSCREREERR